jgi:hypothetical protein
LSRPADLPGVIKASSTSVLISPRLLEKRGDVRICTIYSLHELRVSGGSLMENWSMRRIILIWMLPPNLGFTSKP